MDPYNSPIAFEQKSRNCNKKLFLKGSENYSAELYDYKSLVRLEYTIPFENFSIGISEIRWEF
ncbi:hypothetical protein Lbys_1241 [Leadbetterella byssophila DSM 17132]|uniref:Uncharacterized protein n=1 Tax=Leadbetterella byssophila (strain DSM 17132 / JCM 16389 / KACC 11308 / NBRC 106382 / 4M15) TaxID=649349 RepID=E4RUC7_LEAB4|nr:hypothetical protein Lbys_1241 [Leadbetterella byssophila DSM 17132]